MPLAVSVAASRLDRMATSPQRQIIAIVDDRRTNLKILERLARSLGDGVEIETFDRPQAAMEAAEERPPDLLVTDLKMPGVDGIALIRRFRALRGCAELPIMALTASEDRSLRLDALEAGATDFLPSPVDHDEFRVRARNLLTLRRQQRELAQRASSLEQQILAEERRHQAALRESHELLMRVIDAVPVMVSATDRDGRFVFVNECYARRVNKPAASIIGLTPVEVRDDLQARATMERDRRIVAHSEMPGTFEETIADANGERRVLLTTKALLQDRAGPAVLVVTASLDITDRKEAELALLQAKEEAELASRSKTEFLANMSHELRTPLNAIIGFSQVMADELMGPLGSARYTGYARDICSSAQHLLGIISDILDVSKLEAGKAELDEEEGDLAAIVGDVLQLVRERARALEVGLAIDVPADLPAIRIDVLKLKQVLLNLVTNAIKFSHAGGEVALSAGLAADALQITVSDRGIGMDEDEIATAVSRFGQVASAWSRKHPGTGLGLPLAIGLVELHGGTLAIESRKGVGTTVTVRLPLDRIIERRAAASA
ncbi:MAG TPA: ATP-binding protein [Stellaceae bacterium]|nr:ATP-binding protein [Stellaceae bacterium]